MHLFHGALVSFAERWDIKMKYPAGKKKRKGKKKMAKEILAVIDMQNDFIDGALGTKEAQAIVGKVAEVIKDFDGDVVYTRDTHTDNYLDTQEGRKLPVPHCIKGTKGWEICDTLKALQTENTKIIDKPVFGSVELAQYLAAMPEVTRVTLVGLCTDICVIANAMVIRAFLPETEIRVLADACAGVTPESHKNALDAMKMCQVTVE